MANKSCKMTHTTESKQLYNIDVYFNDGVEINELFVILTIVNIFDFILTLQIISYIFFFF